MRPVKDENMNSVLMFVTLYYQQHHSPPSLDEVRVGTGLPRSSTYKYLKDLADRGCFQYDRGIQSAPAGAKVKTSYVEAPVVGSICCGDPCSEEENIEEYVSLPVSIFGNGDLYLLKARGDSMTDAGIEEDDILVIERTKTARKGDIVVALDDCNENTLKRYGGYDRRKGCYILLYENEKVYPGEVIMVRDLNIQGVLRNIIKQM